MNPSEFERYVADVLGGEGWKCEVTPPGRDFGLDVVCEKDGHRLGVQVKMYGSGRPVNSQIVFQLYGAAAFRDCDQVMLVTDGRALDDAVRVSDKLGIEIRYLPRPDALQGEAGEEPLGVREWTFDRVWQEQVMGLVGRQLTRSKW